MCYKFMQIFSIYKYKYSYEIYVHTNRKRGREQFKVEGYEEPEVNYFDMDTTSDNPIQSFTKLVHFLRETNKI